MSIRITLDLPSDVEQRLRGQSQSLENDVREAYCVELFRRGKLSHFELAQSLGLDRFETDALLKRHNIVEGSLTKEDLEQDWQTLRSLFGTKR